VIKNLSSLWGASGKEQFAGGKSRSVDVASQYIHAFGQSCFQATCTLRELSPEILQTLTEDHQSFC